jgi:hypothetical protein
MDIPGLNIDYDMARDLVEQSFPVGGGQKSQILKK